MTDILTSFEQLSYEDKKKKLLNICDMMQWVQEVESLVQLISVDTTNVIPEDKLSEIYRTFVVYAEFIDMRNKHVAQSKQATEQQAVHNAEQEDHDHDEQEAESLLEQINAL